MPRGESANAKWLFVATAWSALVSGLPNSLLKPLLTYVGLPLDAQPVWWVALDAIIAAGLVFALMSAFRHQGSPRIVSWGPVLFLALSQVMWLWFISGFASAGAPTDELLAAASLPWPQWLLSSGLFVVAGFAGAHLTPQSNPALPGKGWMIGSWAWVGLVLIGVAVALWGMATVRDILRDVQVQTSHLQRPV